jgi:beta-RFAP synthase
MIRVHTGSRLHFGLLNFTAAQFWPNLLGEHVVPIREFGGVGLMVQVPGIKVTVESARCWSAEGHLAGRALEYARRFAESYPVGTIQPAQIVVGGAPAEHSGLGTGTQLGLAVATALARANKLGAIEVVNLARRTDRGIRSALGIHGFAAGGFLVEGGKQTLTDVAPLIARVEFPEEWRVLVIVPRGRTGIHGATELNAFRYLQQHPRSPDVAGPLCRLALLGLIPALMEQDFAAFSEYLFDFNVRVGEAFSKIQGGRYGHPKAESIITFLRKNGVCGVGQSSWGPALFAVLPGESEATDWARCLGREFSLNPSEVFVAPPCNSGATLTEDG